MSGTVAVVCQDLARYHTFTIAALQLKLPPDISWDWRFGFNVAMNRNKAVQNMQGDWLFFLDDDQTFEPDVLLKLLDRSVDVIQALTPARVPPFAPHAYRWIDNDFRQAAPHEVPETGISEWDAVACGCMLIRKHVLEAIEPPWFAVSPDGRTDDLYFCKKVREKGFRVYIDSDTRCGHMTVTQIRPKHSRGAWGAELCFGDELWK